MSTVYVVIDLRECDNEIVGEFYFNDLNLAESYRKQCVKNVGCKDFLFEVKELACYGQS